MASLSRPVQPVVQKVYSYNAERYLWHDITNEQVYNYDPGFGLQTTVNSPSSAPGGQAQYASLASFALRGLGTGVKAIVNQGVKTLGSTATLGFYEAGNALAVNRWDQSVGYDQAAFAARISGEITVGLLGGAAAQSTKYARVGAAVNAYVREITPLARVTTAEAKAAETARIQAEVNSSGFIPIGNLKSFRP